MGDGVLSVRRRLYGSALDELKTKGSRRQLPLPADLQLRLGEGEPTGFVFRARNGSPLDDGNAMRRYVRPAAIRLGLRLGGWHDFRHYFTRQLRLKGLHPKVVSALLGHSRVQLALDCYDRVLPDEYLNPTEPKTQAAA